MAAIIDREIRAFRKKSRTNPAMTVPHNVNNAAYKMFIP
jgi:hypothetical protein